jgi:hypothetical protein
MELGAYTFALLPGQMTIIKAVKSNAAVQTYTNVAFFSWDASIIGKPLTLTWNAMTTAQLDSIDAIYQADTEVVFDATDIDGVSDTYNVQVPNFTGVYFRGDIPQRLSCVLELLIMSVV